MAARVGVVLSGCGVFDGSEIHEVVSILIALDRRGARIICMAPNVLQAGVVNHLTKKADPQSRGVLEESARIARGSIRDIGTVNAGDLDALVFPGGLGAARNLCTFATDGSNCTVNTQVQRLVQEMVQAKKPIAFACIAPVLAARILGSMGLKPKVTIGTDAGTAHAINAMNSTHQEAGPTDICVDETNRLVTTPCYMTAAGPWEVYQGADKMVEQMLRMVS